MTEWNEGLQPQAGRPEAEEEQKRGGKGYDFLSPEEVDEVLAQIPNTAVDDVLKDAELNPGKNYFELGVADDSNTVIIVDHDSEIVEENGVIRSEKIKSEIHDNKTDIIVARKGRLRIVVGRVLAGKENATTENGAIRPGEWVGEGVIHGEVFDLEEGQGVLVHAGWSHVHGTYPGETSVNTFGKKLIENPSPPLAA